MQGSRTLTTGPVTIAAISPEASELLDAACEAWTRDHPGKDITDEEFSPYRTLYWFIRWSGCLSAGENFPP